MNTQPKFYRLYGECRDGQWNLVCLDFSLAVQDESLAIAKNKLRDQVNAYVKDANGVDKEHQEYLLSRSAPFAYWAKFYFYGALIAIAHRRKIVRAHIASKRPMSVMHSAA